MSDKKPGLGRVSWLLERMNATHHPITDEQVERFGRHPTGPILPDECLEVKRFYGKALALGVCPDGKPYLITHGFGRKECLLTNGDFMHPLGFDPNTHVPSFLGYVSSFGPGNRANISEHIAELKPLISARSKRVPAKSKIFLHNSKVYEGPPPIAMLADGQLVFMENGIPRIGGEGICSGRVNLRHLRALSTGELAMIHEVDPFDTELRIYSPAEGKLLEINNYRIHAKVIGLAEFEPGLVAIIDGRKGYGDVEISEVWTKDEGIRPVRSPRPSMVRYRRGAIRIDNSGGFAHIGETARDKFVCMYTDNKPGPGFDFVSPLFTRDAEWLYYATLDQHLYSMKLPEPDSL